MCGIAGLLCLGADCRDEDHVARVSAVCAAQAHRGPDDQGLQALGPVCLGAVRLSILDLSPAGHMPMPDASGRWWITYNGEIYNFRALRAELEQLGHRFRSESDTEVALHALIEWGEEALERFTGMFALAFHDSETGALTLARDRFGIKPLYLRRAGEHVLFASEIGALLAGGEAPRLDRASLLEWFLYRSVDGLAPRTLFEGVRSVLPGQVVTLAGGVERSRTWYAPAGRVRAEEWERFARLPAAKVRAELERALAQSVVDRLVSDVPVGTLMSGGLDSNLVTALAARERELTSFHVSVAGYPELDERPFAVAAAEHLGVELVCDELTAAGFRRELPRAIARADAPLTHPNSVAYARICRVARERGVIVLLSGEGADELFGGYAARYRRLRRLARIGRALRRLPARWRRRLEIAAYAGAGLPVASFHFEELLPQAVDLIDRGARRAHGRACAAAYDFVRSADERALLGAMLADLSDFLAPLLRRLDRMSMGASVECRVPFLDQRLVERAIHLPLAYRVGRRADKRILQDVAARHLPERLARRRKMGFPLPLADYLAPLAREELFAGGFLREVLDLSQDGLRESLASWRASPDAFFSLLACEMWGRMAFLGETPEAIEERVAALERGHA